MSGNPILTLLDLNGSLQGQDRNGIFTATGSGALRWQPAEGARTNWFTNPGLASNSTSWSDAGSAVGARTADTDFESDYCWESVATASTSDGFDIVAQMRATSLSAATLTVGVSTRLVSGSSDWQVCAQLVDASGSTLGSAGSYVDLVPTVSVSRSVLTITNPTQSGASGVQLQFRRKTAAASAMRTGDVTIESGSTTGAWFIPVWLDPITGQLGTPHASPSVSEACAWVEESTILVVPNPWRAVDNTGWSALNGTTGRTTSYAYQGPAAGLITATGANAEERISITAAAASHTAQAVVRNLAAASRQCRLTYNGSLIGSPVSVAAGASATITAPFTGTGSAANLGVRWIDSANTETFVTYYLGGEKKTYATSPCPAIDASGTIQTGYSWAGTAHQSVSTRTQTTTSVDVTNDDRIDTAQGAMVARYRLGGLTNHHQVVVHHGIFSGAGDSIGIENHTGGQARTVAQRGGTVEVANGGAVPAVGVDSILWGEWDSSTLYAQQDSSPLVTASANTPSGVPSSSSLYIGGGSLLYRELNGYIGPVAIYDALLSDARRALVNTAIDNGDDLWSLFAGNPYTFFQLRPY